MTKEQAEKILQKPVFGDAECIKAVERLNVDPDLIDLLRTRSRDDPDEMSLAEILELAERYGY